MSPVSLVFHTKVTWDWSQICYLNKDTCSILLNSSNRDVSSSLLHKFGHRNKRNLTLAPLLKTFFRNKPGWDSIMDAILYIANPTWSLKHYPWHKLFYLNLLIYWNTGLPSSVYNFNLKLGWPNEKIESI